MPFSPDEYRIETESEVVTVLRKARALLERPGSWCQGKLRTPEGQRCVFGAIDDAAGRLAYEESAIFMKAIGCTSIADWNNTPGRTHAEILAAFDLAIELASS